MKTITATTQATTEKGTVINLTITATRGWEKVKEVLYSDGWETEVESTKEINKTEITALVNGQKFTGNFRTGVLVPSDYKRQGVFAIFADKIGLSEIVYNQLNLVCEAAKTEAETDENWIRLQAQKAQSRKEEAEYQANYKSVENAMTLNGRTY